jgi:alkyl hydroperoxide reductase subunit AhpC
LLKEDAGVEARGRFIIDPDGVVQGYEVLTPPVGRKVNETIRQVQAFQINFETKGAEATPSGWRQGKQTLKPVSTWWERFGEYGKLSKLLTN